ncbi:MAG: FeoA family protein [Smithellaceae bacterium]|nr:FeoA family protein [Smithellaceae bacterium]
MSPLALLKEGEMAEIVEQHAGLANEDQQKYRHQHGHTHVHSHGQKICCGQCDNYTCPGPAQSQASDHLMNMGLRPGKLIEMITNSGTGPLVLKLDESRIALSRGMAMKIYVRRNQA